jgi:hypothetical protein
MMSSVYCVYAPYCRNVCVASLWTISWLVVGCSAPLLVHYRNLIAWYDVVDLSFFPSLLLLPLMLLLSLPLPSTVTTGSYPRASLVAARSIFKCMNAYLCQCMHIPFRRRLYVFVSAPAPVSPPFPAPSPSPTPSPNDSPINTDTELIGKK